MSSGLIITTQWCLFYPAKEEKCNCDVIHTLLYMQMGIVKKYYRLRMGQEPNTSNKKPRGLDQQIN